MLKEFSATDSETIKKIHKEWNDNLSGELGVFLGIISLGLTDDQTALNPIVTIEPDFRKLVYPCEQAEIYLVIAEIFMKLSLGARLTDELMKSPPSSGKKGDK